MAAWQYDLQLIPRAGLMRQGMQAKDKLTTDELESVEWRDNDQIPPGLLDRLSSIFPEQKAWANGWSVFGSENGTRIDVMFTGRKIDEVRVRIDARDVSRDQLEYIANFSQSLDVVLIGPDGEVFEPSISKIATAMSRSEAVRFVREPIEFLQSVGIEKNSADQ